MEPEAEGLALIFVSSQLLVGNLQIFPYDELYDASITIQGVMTYVSTSTYGYFDQDGCKVSGDGTDWTASKWKDNVIASRIS
jgi:hypothetical protein